MAESDQDPQANPPQRVSLDKDMVKEALSELLNETPAFRQFLTKKALQALLTQQLATQVALPTDQVS